MSPRRRLDPGEAGLFCAPRPRRRWGLRLTVTLSGAVAVTAMAVCAWVLLSHQSQRRASIKDVAALGYVHAFMTEFTSPDPFHANAYTDRILAQAAGQFAEQYRENENEILVQVARSEPATGTVLDAGVARWNDDGSVDVLVVTKFTSRSPDGKLTLERENRWIVTAQQDGERWKVSGLIPIT
ncbi:mammalian cell entry protein [Mycobacterium sp. 050134]|uniref:mammalian cell entry protein n=1 Tax=Mycobacterium sp. 050134 TaxID=3096111 RepID=UPI002EDA5DDB